MGKELVDSVLEDFESAPVDDAMKAMLRFLKKMTLEPHEMTVQDALDLKEAGVPKRAAEDAALVAFCFNLIDRLADSFDFAVPSPEALAKAAPMMLKRGYKM